MDYKVTFGFVTLSYCRDHSIWLSVRLDWLSNEPIDGVYNWKRYTVLNPVRYRQYENDYSRIVNLCIPCRMKDIEINSEIVNLFQKTRSDDIMYQQTFHFCHAEELRALIRALSYYDIVTDLSIIESDLPF